MGQTEYSKEPTRILFVFDASKSMVNTVQGTTRMEGAKLLFFRFVDSLSKYPNYKFALRMYGHTVAYPPGDCNDTKLVVPFNAKNAINQIKLKIANASPTGITPIEHSLVEAANDFPDKKARNIIILITDGIEECEGDPCRARQKLYEKGIVFKPFVIGIGLTPMQIKTFECVGEYHDFEDKTVFEDITETVKTMKKKKTSLQVNLNNLEGEPKETNVNMTFQEVDRGVYRYNFIHTLNKYDNPDTLYLDDFPTYKVKAHTIPPVESGAFKIVEGKHTTVAIDAPQGGLSIKRPNGIYNKNQSVKYIVRHNGKMQTLHVQSINTWDKYIVGKYDIEVLTLPRTYFKNVEIKQSIDKEITLESAGLLLVKCLEAGDGCILKETDNRREWVTNLTDKTKQTFYLQPGNYILEWRSKSLKGSIYTLEKKFTIVPDQPLTVELYR